MTENIGSAALYLTVDTSQMEVAINRAKQRVSGMSAQAQQEYAKLDRAEKRRVDSLIRQADTIGFTRQQQIAYDAALKTHGSVLDDITRRLARNNATAAAAGSTITANTKAFSGNAKTARELQFAMRGLPAQITDIFTGLASGQRPMMVLIQQGGQLKDMFGGIKPAASALAGAIRGLINPFTLAAGGAFALGLAWKQAEDEGVKFNRTIIETGNHAQVSAGEMQDMASRLDGLQGVTQRSASAAISAVAATGRFTRGELETVSRAAAAWSAATGASVDDVVKQFVKLADDPLKAIQELDKSQHFLTNTIRNQIRSLADQGREVEAARLAIDTYANTLNNRSPQITENLGHIEKGWRFVKQAASEAWDAMLAGGRDDTLADLDRKISAVQKRLGGNLLVGDRESLRKLLSDLQAQADPLRRNLASAGVASALSFLNAPIDDSKKIEAEKAWAQLVESNLSKRAKLEKEVLQIMQAGLAAGKGQAEIAAQVAAARQRYKDSLPKAKQTAEEKAAEKLAAAYESQNATLARTIALHGEVGRAAAMAYDLQYGPLKALNAELKAGLQEQAEWLDWLDDMAALDAERAKVSQDATNARLKAAAESTDRMTEFSRQAARNMQSDFADFLFDPFADGADGMAEAFGNAIRRMMAEAAAAKLFDALGTFATSKASGTGGIWDFIAGALTKNAKGNVYNSPGLSAYSNGIYNTPQYFAHSGVQKYAKGAGVFGEAGWEGIFPLKRMGNGDLGVQANGMGEVNVNIYNAPAGATVSKRKNDSGGFDIDVMFRQIEEGIAGNIASGASPVLSALKGRTNLAERV